MTKKLTQRLDAVPVVSSAKGKLYTARSLEGYELVFQNGDRPERIGRVQRGKLTYGIGEDQQVYSIQNIAFVDFNDAKDLFRIYSPLDEPEGNDLEEMRTGFLVDAPTFAKEKGAGLHLAVLLSTEEMRERSTPVVLTWEVKEIRGPKK